MSSFKELCRSRIIHDGYYGMCPAYHIRYDIHPDFLRELFEDEEKIAKGENDEKTQCNDHD